MNKKNIINKNISIKEALKKMKHLGVKNLFIKNSQNQLIGSLSGGDIRSAILKKKNLSESVFAFSNFKPKFIKDKNNLANKKKLNFLFKKYKLDLIPIVDENNRIKDIISWSDFYKQTQSKTKKINQFKNKVDVIIMAGGRGTRLKPFTDILPKPLMPIKNKTVIEHILNSFTKHGLKNFFITINFKSEILKAYLKELSLSYNFNFIKEKKPLGTIGAVKLIKKNTKNIIITNCDVIHKIDINDFYNFHFKNDYDISLIASSKKYRIPYGICRFNEKNFEKFDEKPELNFFVNTGLYIIKNKLKKIILKNQRVDATDFINLVKSKKYSVGVYKIKDNQWFDTGKWSELNKTLKNLNI
jgi:dTDP-glucose pyrophosphorylase